MTKKIKIPVMHAIKFDDGDTDEWTENKYNSLSLKKKQVLMLVMLVLDC